MTYRLKSQIGLIRSRLGDRRTSVFKILLCFVVEESALKLENNYGKDPFFTAGVIFFDEIIDYEFRHS